MRARILVALVALMTVALFAQADEATATGITCADSDGIWEIPDGLILGGPLGNQDTEPYKSWLAECEFQVETFTATVYTPLADAVASWESCVASSHPHAGIGSHEGADQCGAPPSTLALPNSTVPVTLTGVHKGTPRGSVRYTNYIHPTKSTSNAADPVNVFFYGNGNPTLVASKLQFHSNWRSTTGHHPTACSSDKYVYIWDYGHSSGGVAGVNDWHLQRNMQEKDWRVSHAGSGDCMKERYHSRLFSPGLVDSHSPSWGKYLPAAFHSELQDHQNSGVDPNNGRGRASSDTAGQPWVQSTALLYIGNFGCATCARHDGYELNVKVY